VKNGKKNINNIFFILTTLMAKQTTNFKSKSKPKISLLSKKYNHDLAFLKQNTNNEIIKNLGFYLAGLIEGDDYISITKENRVILGIVFNIKDQPLAEKILNCLGKGSIVKRKSNSIELRFSEKKTILRIVTLINGKFRTPKKRSII
jgi:LAGLIDADG endonuclease